MSEFLATIKHPHETVVIPFGDVCHVHVFVDMRFHRDRHAHADVGMAHQSVQEHRYT